MAAIEEMLSWSGRTVVDRDGNKIGAIDEIVIEDETDEPVFALVQTGLFGTHRTFVPLDGADDRGGDVVVPFDKQRVQDAPRADRDEVLTPQAEAELYRYYGMPYVDDRGNRLRSSAT
jgi:hypothetical protein